MAIDIKKTHEKFSDKRAASQKKREARREVLRSQKKTRRKKVLRFAACLLVLALFVFLALMVGDSDYKACIVGWTPLLMFVIAIVLSFFYVRILAKGLQFEENGMFHDCSRGEKIPFNVSFHNKTVLFAFKVEAVFCIADMFSAPNGSARGGATKGGASRGAVKGSAKFSDATTSKTVRTLSLSPKETIELDFSAQFEHIGKYEVGLTKIIVSDFLGLFSKTILFEHTHSVLVTPKLHEIGGIDFSSDAETESAKAAKSVIADSMDYAYVRDYVPGDPLKTIHWKLSSRNPQGHYYTRLFERYTLPGVSIVLDFCAPDSASAKQVDEAIYPQLFDAIVESGLSIARYARRCGFDTHIIFYDDHGQKQVLTGRDQEDLCALVSKMPALAMDGNQENTVADLVLEQTQDRSGDNNIVVCSANLDSELISAVLDARMRRRFPFFVAAVPQHLVDADLAIYTKPLKRFDTAEIPYTVLADSISLEKVAL